MSSDMSASDRCSAVLRRNVSSSRSAVIWQISRSRSSLNNCTCRCKSICLPGLPHQADEQIRIAGVDDGRGEQLQFRRPANRQHHQPLCGTYAGDDMIGARLRRLFKERRVDVARWTVRRLAELSSSRTADARRAATAETRRQTSRAAPPQSSGAVRQAEPYRVSQ